MGADGQLTMLGLEAGRDDFIDVVVCDVFGRVLDVIPAHLGDRHEPRERWSLHAAALWGSVTTKRAAERLPPPTWATFPVHDPPAATWRRPRATHPG
jgi:hypothetical protein